MRSKTNKPKANFYNEFRSILPVRYSLIEKRLLSPLHKTHMKKYLQLENESQILREALKILDGKYINEILDSKIDKMENQKEELFQELIDSKALTDNEPLTDSEANSDS